MVYPISRILIGKSIINLWVNKITGLHNVPKNQQFILASNHISMLDGLLFLCIIAPYINKKLHFYVNSKFFPGFFLKKILDWGGGIPVFVKEKRDPKLNEIAHKKALEYLKIKEPIGVFPEGSVTQDGKLKKAKKGLARLVMDSKAKVLPVALLSRGKILGSKKLCPPLKGYEVRIGKLINFKDKKIKYISYNVMKKIGILLKQDKQK